MFDNATKELSREERRFAAADLAAKIRFLREEIREGRNTTENLAELQAKTTALARLYEAPNNKARIGFEVRDTGPADNASGFTFGKRVVEINNPKATQGAEGTHLISVIPPALKDAQLKDFGTCEVLAPAYGGI